MKIRQIRSILALLKLREGERVLFLCVVISATLLAGCKKYPEGGAVHRLMSNESRIDGPRFLTEFSVDGTDSSAAFRNLLNSTCPDVSFHFLFGSSDVYSSDHIISSGCIPYPANNWFVTEDCRHFVLTTRATPSARSYYPFLMNKDAEISWDIEKLTRDDFWLKTNYNGKHYYLKLRYYH